MGWKVWNAAEKGRPVFPGFCPCENGKIHRAETKVFMEDTQNLAR
jgi:hypothetical protein